MRPDFLVIGSSVFDWGITKLLAGVGLTLGVGNAVYDLEQAGDLNLLAKAGTASENQLIAEPNQAQLNYHLAIANLVMAGVDIGFDLIADARNTAKLAEVAREILSPDEARIIAKLEPEEINKLYGLATSTDEVQSQKLLQSLKQELGKDFDTAYSVFARANQQVGGKTFHLAEDYWDMELGKMARLDPEFTKFPELKSIQDLITRNPSQKKELLNIEIEKLRLNLLRNTQDLGKIYDVMRRSGFRVSREDIALVKKYNFNSPGINFNPDNYKSWMKLAKGEGTIDDARYLVHEIEEIKQLKKIQQETGFDFMGKDFFKMDKEGKRAWELQFHDKPNKTGYYLQAHSKAVKYEYEFMSRQIAKITKGEVNLNGKDDYLKLIFSEPNKGAKDDHIKNMLIHGRVLEKYIDEGVPEYVELAEAAQQPIQLSPQIKQELRLYDPVTLEDLITAARQKSLNKLR